MSLKNRIAVCISGQIRTGVYTTESLKKFFGDMLPNLDFFIHTWTTETVSPHGLRDPDEQLNTAIEVSQYKIDHVTEFYKPKLMIVDNYTEYEKKYIKLIEDRYGMYGVCYSSIPLLQTIYESNKLKIQYENKVGEQYPLVIRMRFDQVFEQQHRLINEIRYIADRQDLFYVSDPNNKLPNEIEDLFWISNSNNMNIISELSLIRSSKQEYNLVSWQLHTRHLMEDHKIIPRPMKNNNIFLYRNYHAKRNISPLDTDAIGGL